ncbi:MAG TPA: ABC transporter permease, partial [Oceanipulchritudo sp.]|nr:ABC transporter permease [Oceanipulchritudo sp.]
AFRIFFKRPGLTLLAILALAVSVGMSISTFSVLNGMFLKPLPFKDPQNLHHIYLSGKNLSFQGTQIPFENLPSLEALDPVQALFGFFEGTLNLSGDGPPERHSGAFVSPRFLEILGHKPLLGRSFTSREDSFPGEDRLEILISHRIWQDRYNGDPAILGNEVRANGSPRTIVGILPEGFHFPRHSDVWVPLSPNVFPGGTGMPMYVSAVARLDPNRSPAELQQALNSAHARWKAVPSDGTGNMELRASPFGRLELNEASTSYLIAVTGAVIFILLVSCANVANLLIGRALTRGREMAVRSALGASRGRILRQLLTESLVLSAMGTVGGLLYAAWSLDLAIESKVFEIPYWMRFDMDWRVILFALFAALTTTLISGLVPAWQSSKTDLSEMLKDTAHTSTSFRLGRFTRSLAVVQIAFACALLFAAGLAIRTTHEMSRLDPGYSAEEILTMRMGLFQRDYPGESDRDAFYAALTEKVEALPGVRSAAVSNWLWQFGNPEEPFIAIGKNAGQPSMAYAFSESVSPGYFKTMQMDLLAGRAFSHEDTAASPLVAVVNESFAQRHFDGLDALGQQVELPTAGGLQEEANRVWTVVGVVSDVRVSRLTHPVAHEATLYTASTQQESPFMSLIVHSSLAADPALQERIQDVILQLDENLPVYFIKTFQEVIQDHIYPYDLMADFFLTVGLMALFLAAIGVYGMLAFNVSRRRREIGIRMAMGADSRRIVLQMLQQGFIQVTFGILFGTGLAYLAGQLAHKFLVGINPVDPSVYLGVLLILAGVAALAFFLPARRAARLSPLEALRYE